MSGEKIISVKGTRDFYPEQMRFRNWIVDTWRRVSLRNGFEEYDAPIFEYLDLFTIKSGDEIASQLFNFTDRGGRNLAIRPEITPSLARMVNAKINTLPRPIKWFSLPRLCRAENPQKGRLREFFQWNVDVIGADSVLADAECIFTAVDFLREVGLTSDEIQVRIGSRVLTVAALKLAGVPVDKIDTVLPVLDKRPKISEEAFDELAAKAGLDNEQIAAIRRFQDVGSIDEIAQAVGEQGGEAAEHLKNLPQPSIDFGIDFGDDSKNGVSEHLKNLRQLMRLLKQMGVSDYCRLDMRIVRGLAYYTGIVYEIFDAGKSLRAIAGGGRYDNLLEVLGGPKVGATGFGMGDVVLGILLEEKGKVPDFVRSRRLDYFVIDGQDGTHQSALQVVGDLRQKGHSADFSYARRSVGKQLKEANKRGAKKVVIVRADGITLKDMSAGEQSDMSLEAFLKNSN